MKSSLWILMTAAALGALLSVAALAQGQATSTSPKIEAEVVSLRVGGFFPPKITRPPGQFLLVVKNRAGTTSMTLSIASKEAAMAVPSASVLGFNQDYLLNLAPDTYVLADSSHPKWTPLTIVIQ